MSVNHISSKNKFQHNFIMAQYSIKTYNALEIKNVYVQKNGKDRNKGTSLFFFVSFLKEITNMCSI